MKPECGDRFISEFNVDENAVLQRILNRAGVPYSIILVDGKEILSTETSHENGMIDFYKKNKKIYAKED